MTALRRAHSCRSPAVTYTQAVRLGATVSEPLSPSVARQFATIENMIRRAVQLAPSESQLWPYLASESELKLKSLAANDAGGDPARAG